MATFRAVILRGGRHTKADGTTNIKIRVTHRREQQYISTDLYCKPGLFQQGLMTGQDSAWINSRITDLLATYHHRYLKLGTVVNKMTAHELKEELMADESISEIDFIEFAEKYIEKLKQQGRMGSVRGFRGVMMRLKEYRPHLNASDVTKSFLIGFEAYLRKSGVSNGVSSYMARIRLIFNVARDEYNDEDRGIVRIPHYPFRKYKIRHPVAPKNEDSLTVEQIKLLFDFEPIYNRETLAIDVMKIMFCLCGINSKDLYYLPKCNKLGRIEFNRAKTGRKYSIRVEPELSELIRKYHGVWYCFDFDQRYRDYENFQKAVNIGLKSICKRIHAKAKEENRNVDFPVGITTNWARHSWATIARNDCGLSKDDVALCLGHGQKTVTDVYIKKDYRIQDEANRKVLDKIFS